ncbi:MAG: hypothetical protein Crog4KO_23730 [Crocinitomicaceae bacterium]
MPCTTCPTGGDGAGCEDIQNVKHFFYFKVGSWWVYEEENSGLRDSVYVTSASENPSNYDFNVEVYSTHQDYYYRYWPIKVNSNECPTNGIICKRCIQIKRSKYRPGDFVNESTCFLFVSKIGDNQYVPNTEFENNRIYVENVLDSLIGTQNFVFDRTIQIRESNTYIEGMQPTNHFFSENVGLVRKELLDSNQIWNLVDYHIEK